MKELTNIQAIRKYFGLKEGQTLSEFMQELKELSPESKQELGDLARAQLS